MTRSFQTRVKKRSFIEAASYYFLGEGRGFLRLLLGGATAFGVADDATVVGIADDFITYPMLLMIVIKIWRRRNRDRFPGP